MDKTQAFDPNRTMLNNPDLMRTQAMTSGPQADPNRTSMMAAGSLPAEGITVQIIPSREATMANGPAREQFLVEISAGGGMIPGMGVSAPRTPLNLCLVIDRSGSMEGMPLEYVKQACGYVVDMLGPNDVLSIVTFEEVVEVLMPPQMVTDKAAIKSGIMQLQAGNTTNLSDALSLGLQQINSLQDPGRATRMVVFTDGEPTAGMKDFNALVTHAGEIKQRGVSCTFLGFGSEYNEELLASMAKKAGGNYYYIPQPQLIPEVFRLEMDKLLTTAAQHLKLEMKLARWVSLRSATGLATPPSSREFEINLTDLERGSSLEQIFDLEMTNHPLGWYRVAEGKLSYTDTNSGATKTIAIDLVIEFTADASKYSVAPNPRVSNAAEMALASRAVEKTIMGLKTGQITSMVAISELQKTQALLLNDGRTAEAQEVTLALRALQSGDQGTAEKTLMGTMVQLDQGKKSGQ